MMLSVVGMLNYMGNQEIPICTSLDGKYDNQMPLDEYRIAKVSEAKSELQQEYFVEEDWSMDVNVLDDPDPVYDEFAHSGDLVPARQSQLHTQNSILNRTHSGVTLEEAYVAFDMRESYLQRHASPLARYSDTTDLHMKDFATKTNNMWKTDEAGLFPDFASCASKNSPTENMFQDKVSFISA